MYRLAIVALLASTRVAVADPVTWTAELDVLETFGPGASAPRPGTPAGYDHHRHGVSFPSPDLT